MITSVRPDWRLPVGQRTGTVLGLEISVQVDSVGQPRMQTIDVTGLGATENRDAAAAWLQSTRCRPAPQAGRGRGTVPDARAGTGRCPSRGCGAGA